MVGTPWQMVTPSCSIRSRPSTGSNSLCRISVPPVIRVETTTCMPKTVKNGTVASTRSACVWPSASVAWKAAYTRLWWVSTTPFGLPIVPDV